MKYSIPDIVLWPLVMFATLAALVLIIVIALNRLEAHKQKKIAERKSAEARQKFEGVIWDIRKAGGL